MGGHNAIALHPDNLQVLDRGISSRTYSTSTSTSTSINASTRTRTSTKY